MEPAKISFAIFMEILSLLGVEDKSEAADLFPNGWTMDRKNAELPTGVWFPASRARKETGTDIPGGIQWL